MRPVVIYDVNVLPESNDVSQNIEVILDIFEKKSIIFWDSSKATEGQNCKPQVILLPDTTPVHVMDVQTVEGKSQFELAVNDVLSSPGT